jgi:ADP-ribose pyrophosphatase YjhB (NUDIX family)
MDGYDYLVVTSCLIVDDGEVLLVQEGKDHVEGLWNLPAGKLEMGESPQDGCVREAEEETGLDVDLKGFIGVYMDESDSSDDTVLNMVFAGEADGRAGTPEDDTVQDVAWVGVDELDGMELRAPYIEVAVRAYRDRGALPLDAVQDVALLREV